jgi:lipoprotein Spr
MKKRVLPYLIAIISVFSMQSCVSNYVVSKPTKFKSYSNLNKLNSKNLNAANKSVNGSYNANFANAQKSEIAAAISDAINHEQTIDTILNEATTYLGTPYRYGGTTRSGIDCSAFVLNVFGESIGMELPRVASDQSELGEKVEVENLEKGDLIFFSHGWGISHVGIVQEITGDGEIMFIHAATSKGVMISSLNDSYWGSRYRFAKRVIK